MERLFTCSHFDHSDCFQTHPSQWLYSPTSNLILISDWYEAHSNYKLIHLPQTLFWSQLLVWDTPHSVIEPPCPTLWLQLALGHQMSHLILTNGERRSKDLHLAHSGWWTETKVYFSYSYIILNNRKTIKRLQYFMILSNPFSQF
jgi:hypothetical protein